MSCNIGPPRVNPFVNTTSKLTLKQKFRYIFPGCILIPLRTALMATSFISGYSCALIATAGLSMQQIEQAPLSNAWRLAAQNGVRYSVRAFLFSLGFHNIRQTGTPVAPKSEAPIIVCSHHAPWEALALFYFHKACFVSAGSNFRMPIVGTCSKACQQIRVERSDASSRGKIRQIISDRALHATFPQVGIFPEGTTTNGKGIISFKNGAFAPGLPIQPIVAIFHWKNNDNIDPTWAGTEVGLGKLVPRLMAQWNIDLELRYLPVYNPTEEEKQNPFLYAENVRKLMAKEMGVPMTDHSLDDMLLQVEALKMKIGDPNQAVLEMEKVKRAFSFDKNDIKLFLQHYKAIGKYAGEGSNRISYSDFLQGLSLPDSSLLREVFAELCGQSARGKEGKITREKVDLAMEKKKEKEKEQERISELIKRLREKRRVLFASSKSKSTSKSANPSSTRIVTSTTSSHDHHDEDSEEENEEEISATSTTVVVLPEPAIQLDEFLQACMAIINIDGDEKNLHDIFTALDIKGDRRLNVDELKAALVSIAPDITNFQVKQLLSRFRSESVSAVGRDEVDYIEFAAFLRNNPLFLKVFSVMLRQGNLKKIKNEAQRSMEGPRLKPVNEE